MATYNPGGGGGGASGQSFYAHQPQMSQIYGSNQVQPVQQQYQTEQSSLNNGQNVYNALLALAHSFQQDKQYRLCIHCLESILSLKPQEVPVISNFYVQIRTRLNLCRLYLRYTTNTNQYVNIHLEKLILIIRNLNINDEFKYEATYTLYKIFQKQRDNHNQIRIQSPSDGQHQQLASIYSLDLLKTIIETSKIYPVWHVRLLFLIGDLLIQDKEYALAAQYMSLGIDFCYQSKQQYPYILFILSKGFIHLLQRNPNELLTTMQPCASLIESFQTPNAYQLECLKIFFLIIQVSYFLQCSQLKSVEGTLKNLQHYLNVLVQRMEQNSEEKMLISPNPMLNLYWMHMDHLGMVVFLLTIVQSIQSGNLERALKLIDKALANLQKLKIKELDRNYRLPYMFNSSSFITLKLNLVIIENKIRCNLAMGNKSLAGKQLTEAFKVCEEDMTGRLATLYMPHLHCLVGMYSMATQSKDQAIMHFNLCLKLPPALQDPDMWLYCLMQLASCHLSTGNKQQLFPILDNLTPDRIKTQSTALTSLSHYFAALKAYMNNDIFSAVESLKGSINLALSENLSNIVTSSSLFLGQIQLQLNQLPESFQTLMGGIDRAEKMQDLGLRIYAYSLLKVVYKCYNDPRESEAAKKHAELEQASAMETFEASKQPSHLLVNWSSNGFPTTHGASKQQTKPVVQQSPSTSSNAQVSPKTSQSSFHHQTPTTSSNASSASPQVMHHKASPMPSTPTSSHHKTTTPSHTPTLGQHHQQHQPSPQQSHQSPHHFHQSPAHPQQYHQSNYSPTVNYPGQNNMTAYQAQMIPGYNFNMQPQQQHHSPHQQQSNLYQQQMTNSQQIMQQQQQHHHHHHRQQY